MPGFFITSDQQQLGDPERAGSETLYSPGQRARAAVGGAGLHQPAVRARRRGLVFQVVSGAARGQDHGSDRAVDVDDRDRSLEDADAVVVPCVFSFCENTVHGACG